MLDCVRGASFEEFVFVLFKSSCQSGTVTRERLFFSPSAVASKEGMKL